MSVAKMGNVVLTGGLAATAGSGTARLSSAAKEFESVLLGQWLKNAESTLGSVPGCDDDDECGDQMKEFAMQHVASEITNRGGIGIAPMLERALTTQEMPRAPKSGGEGH